MLKLNLSKLEPEFRDAARELLDQIGLTEAEYGLVVDQRMIQYSYSCHNLSLLK